MDNIKLKFIHITKTSGTYIENISIIKNIYWGKNDNSLKHNNLPINYNPSYWHIPLNMLPKYPYDRNIKLFTVVRNPYDRIISECFCKWGGKYCSKLDTEDDFNNYIFEQVSKAYDPSFFHFFPQYLYTHYNHKCFVDHILYFENIETEFNDLMNLYNIDIKYAYKEKICHKFTINNISTKNIDLINNIYHYDFVYFNYIKM